MPVPITTFPYPIASMTFRDVPVPLKSGTTTKTASEYNAAKASAGTRPSCINPLRSRPSIWQFSSCNKTHGGGFHSKVGRQHTHLPYRLQIGRVMAPYKQAKRVMQDHAPPLEDLTCLLGVGWAKGLDVDRIRNDDRVTHRVLQRPPNPLPKRMRRDLHVSFRRFPAAAFGAAPGGS